MYKKSSNPSVQYSLNTLADSLLLLLESESFENIRVSKLCETARVSRNSFYNNCNEINDVLEFLFDRYLDEVYMEIDQSKYKTKELLLLFFTYWEKNSFFLKIIYKQNLYRQFLDKLISKGFEKTVYREVAGEQKKYLNAFAIGGLATMLYQWTVDGFRMTPKELSEIMSWEK